MWKKRTSCATQQRYGLKCIALQTTDPNCPNPLWLYIEIKETMSKMLYNTFIHMGASHNLIYFESGNQLGQSPRTQSNIKVKDMNWQTSYVTRVLQRTAHNANIHLEGTFWLMPTR